jgi:hypothetical protein
MRSCTVSRSVSPGARAMSDEAEFALRAWLILLGMRRFPKRRERKEAARHEDFQARRRVA